MTKTKYIGIAVGIIVIVLAVGSAWMSGSGKKTAYASPSASVTTSRTNAAAPTPAPAPGTKEVKTYTLVQVASHAGASDCWTAINGSVYNLTTWIAQHPGGEQAILGICGKDGSAAFNGQHDGDRRAERALASFQIGTLAL